MDDEPDKSLFIFGRDVSKIPCFRSSFLNGIGGGFGVGLLSFLFTSKPGLATHIGFGTFVLGTMGYWFTCRYNYSVKKFNINQLQEAMKKQALFEGTAIEEEVIKNAKSV